MRIFFPFDPCPCGSRKKALTCCLGDRAYHRRPARLTRPQFFTNFAHDRCFLSFWNECSSTISREHYFSEGVIRATKPRALVRESTVNINYPKLFPETKKVGIGSLAAKILCDGHNHMFSPLDARAEELWSAMRDLIFNPTSCPWFRLFNGHDVERWMLKTLLSTFFAVYETQSTGKKLRLPAPVKELSEKTLDILKWTSNSGLYFDSIPIEGTQRPLAFGTGTHDNMIITAEFHMFGVRAILLPCPIDDPAVVVPPSARHRPDGIVFRVEGQRKFIAFSWNHHRRPSGPEDWIQLTLDPQQHADETRAQTQSATNSHPRVRNHASLYRCIF